MHHSHVGLYMIFIKGANISGCQIHRKGFIITNPFYNIWQSIATDQNKCVFDLVSLNHVSVFLFPSVIFSDLPTESVHVFGIMIEHRRNSVWTPHHAQWDGQWQRNTNERASDASVMDDKHNGNINILLTWTICCWGQTLGEERSSLNYTCWWICEQAASSLTPHTPFNPPVRFTAEQYTVHRVLFLLPTPL